MNKVKLTWAESGTRTLFGKPYHWTINNGSLSLVPGEAQEEDNDVEGV